MSLSNHSLGAARVLLGALLCLPAPALPAAGERERFLDAYHAFQKEDYARGRKLASGLENYVLYPYLQYAMLDHDLEHAPAETVHTFMAADGGSSLGEQLRADWLMLLARRQAREDFLRDYTPQRDPTLRCYYFETRLATGWQEDLRPGLLSLWGSDEVLPKSCDAVMAALLEHSDAATAADLRWQRVIALARNNRAGEAAALGNSLPAADKRWFVLWRNMHARPETTLGVAALKTDHPRVRFIVREGIERLAAQDADRAHARWQALHGRYAYSAEEQGAITAAIALAAARQRLDNAPRFLDEVPAGAVTDKVQLAQLMTALQHRDWRRLRQWTERPPAPDMDALCWRYWHARALEETGDAAAAHGEYQSLAQEHDYYGLRAAERLGVFYDITHQPLERPMAEVGAFLKRPAIRRALELRQLGLSTEARREWQYAIQSLDAHGLGVAAIAAYQQEWYDRTLLALNKAHEYGDLEMRYPLPYKTLLEQTAEARGLELPVLYSLIRSESAFSEDIRSPAGAVGLMQLMPATARQTARKLKYPYKGKNELLSAKTNVFLGSTYLRAMLDKYDGNLAMAAAAYNAGPKRVQQWRPADHCTPAEIWVDTIPITETRRYVRGLLYHAAVYEMRLKQAVTPLLKRLAAIPPVNGTPAFCSVN
ncbi:MAG TPA: transglycosylase SLT domain-containing protein [Gammaproteobacteria bacterium]|nr:transglycosylase SLT domain-containing protein [Gammaproteobacteria bacterium]